MAWTPLSVRRGRRAPFELVDGVPDYLKVPLLEWVESLLIDLTFGVREELLNQLLIKLQIPVAQRDAPRRYEALVGMIVRDDDLFLDVLDALCIVAADSRLRELDGLLDNGMSMYRVRRTEPNGLEERLGDEVRTAVSSATSKRDRASDELAAAWAAAFGRHRDATAAWNSAVKAVEHLMHSIVEPNNTKATLGSMVAALRNKPEKWRFEIAAKNDDTTARPFLQALELIGYEPGRHGTDPKRATIEQARIVVLQAVTIVEWLRAGALTRAS
ncbi:hypothetical protein [Cellulosimicrobium sp. SH8]|uniref:hypothetical protein n=1 Tax=Cellulosimicrobium sp. SH8 TaxID=2952936 RepID=UPI0021F3BA1C|nr:hypothetical protein [Cellulosimicrobium sp. SH8]